MKYVKLISYVLAGFIVLILCAGPLLRFLGATTPEAFCQDAVARFKAAKSYEEIKKQAAYYIKNGEFYAAVTGLPGYDPFNKEPPNGVIVMMDYTGRITVWDQWDNGSLVDFFFCGYEFQRRRTKIKNDSLPDRAKLSKKDTIERIRKEISSSAHLKCEFVNENICNENRRNENLKKKKGSDPSAL